MPTQPTIREIAAALEAWAPPASAQSYDNVGLQVGDADRRVAKAVLALDCTPAVLAEAREMGATLIVTHHPLIFRPLRSVTASGFVNTLALRLAESGIAHYAIHTNLDAAPGGVSFALAEQLGLTELRFLDRAEDTLVKLTTQVLAAHAGAVRAALAEVGTATSLLATGSTGGTGGSGGLGHAHGPVERIEVVVPRWDLGRATRALEAAHPDGAPRPVWVTPLLQRATQTGLGAIGRLPEAERLADFLARVAGRLAAGSLRYVGDPEARIETVAVCGGSGSDFTPLALRAGADAYVTADVTYHKFFDVLDAEGHPRMALIDAGHYETEAITEALLRDWLAERFPTVDWQRTRHRTSPMDTFVPA